MSAPIDPTWLARYGALKAHLAEEMRPFVLTLRERIDVVGEPAAVLELFADLQNRPREELGGFALHAMLLLAGRETIE